jgi:hypothetical protein
MTENGTDVIIKKNIFRKIWAQTTAWWFLQKFAYDIGFQEKRHFSPKIVIITMTPVSSYGLQHIWIEDCVSGLRMRCRSLPDFTLTWKKQLVCFVNENQSRYDASC